LLGNKTNLNLYFKYRNGILARQLDLDRVYVVYITLLESVCFIRYCACIIICLLDFVLFLICMHCTSL